MLPLPIDIRLMIVLMATATSVSALIVVLLGRALKGQPGVRDWSVGMGLCAIGAILIALRGPLPLFPSVVGGQGAAFLGSACFYQGARDFCGMRPDWRLAAPVVLLCLAPYLFVYDSVRYGYLRFLFNSLDLSILFMMFAWTIWKHGPRHLAGRRLVLWITAGMSAFQLLRAAYLVLERPVTSDFISTTQGVFLYGWVIVATSLMPAALLVLPTERLRAELARRLDELDEAHRVTETILKEQRNFLAMVSHEFRTPLAVISASAELAMRDPGSSAPVSQEAERIHKASSRLRKLVEKCLADEWLEAAAMNRQHETVDLGEILRMMAEEYRIGLRIDPLSPRFVVGDPSLLSIMFSNLIENGRKYGRTESGVAVECRPWGDGDIAVEIHDDGDGVDPAEVPKLFEKYYRSPGRLETPGAGLGLYFVRKIAESHDGHIEVGPERAGLFRVILPALEAA